MNIFRDFGQHEEGDAITTYGIHSQQSNLTVLNSQFINIGKLDVLTGTDIEADAIFARNDGISNRFTNVTGLNQPPPQPSQTTFSNCYKDITSIGTNVNATNITSYKSGRCISLLMANSWQNPIVCEIKNNKFDYFRQMGVRANLFKPCSIKIEDNIFYDNDEIFDPAIRYGILIENGTLSTEILLPNLRILRNVITSRSILAGGAFYGIGLNRVGQLTIEQNYISEALPQTNIDVFYGIRTLAPPTNGLKLLNNSVKGANINYIFAGGFDIRYSQNTIASCNVFNTINTGMLFVGLCDGAFVSQNSFNQHERGLSLGHPSINELLNIIGEQENRENRWIGSNSVIEAYAKNLPSALGSIFKINSTNLNSIFWPYPRKIDTSDDNFIWFLSSTTGTEADPNEISCYITNPPSDEDKGLSSTDLRILNNTYQAPFGYKALEWEAKWHFIDRLNTAPALMSTSSPAAQFFQSSADSSYSVLNQIYQKYLGRWSTNLPERGEVEQYTSLLETAVQHRFALDSLLSEDNTALHLQMSIADSTIDAVSVILENATNDFNDALDQEIHTWIADIDETICIAEYEKDMQSLIRVLLVSHLAGGTLTNEEEDIAAAIADKCRYKDGYAVLLARALFPPQDYYPQDDDCQEIQPFIGEEYEDGLNTSSTSEVIFPNPADEYVILNSQNLINSGSAKLFNAQGMLVKNLEFNTPVIKIPVYDLMDGIYHLDIKVDSNPSVHKVLIVTHK